MLTSYLDLRLTLRKFWNRICKKYFHWHQPKLQESKKMKSHVSYILVPILHADTNHNALSLRIGTPSTQIHDCSKRLLCLTSLLFSQLIWNCWRRIRKSLFLGLSCWPYLVLGMLSHRLQCVVHSAIALILQSLHYPNSGCNHQSSTTHIKLSFIVYCDMSSWSY